MPKTQNYDAEFKMELVLEVLKGRKASEVATENGVSRNSIYAWKREMLNVAIIWYKYVKILSTFTRLMFGLLSKY